ncbi:hypothetical protein K0J45_18950 [Shewanella alkalitolerans]|uniref:glycosyltransferase family 9 protein n=1 Tax=Shewanella alkalitolerans TaxID=2864209 RepID=UPI001C658DF0|nr:glycosyltransferase family 9 protein [Shewanella alkalitolerans]QYJ97546.1 hypothetical protein K0J45_18950 [Shewanella alkalitolerans]
MSALIEHSSILKAKRVLYMTHLAIGDFVYQGAWLRALKAKYPHLSIDIWFDDCRSKPHDWAKGRNKILSEWINAIGDFDEIYPIVSNLAERQTAIQNARDKNYDIIIFVGKNRSEQFAKVARQISSTAIAVATMRYTLGNLFSSKIHTSKLDGIISYRDIAKQSSHVTDFYGHCFNKIVGLETSDLINDNKQLDIQIRPEYDASVQPVITSLTQGDPSRLIIFINHLSTATKKDYPWPQVKQVIRELNSKYTNLVFVVNTPPDKFESVTAEIRGDSDLNQKQITTFTALNNFFELPAIIGLCDLVISVDTATAHLAVCMSKPQVTLMASDFKLWQPLGDSLILEGAGKARSITANQVIDAVEKQILNFYGDSEKFQPSENK